MCFCANCNGRQFVSEFRSLIKNHTNILVCPIHYQRGLNLLNASSICIFSYCMEICQPVFSELESIQNYNFERESMSSRPPATAWIWDLSSIRWGFDQIFCTGSIKHWWNKEFTQSFTAVFFFFVWTWTLWK